MTKHKLDKKNILISSLVFLKQVSNTAIPPYFLYCDVFVSSQNPVDSEQRGLFRNYPVIAAVASLDFLCFAWLDV